jgi:serine/threonine protein kinase
VDKQKQKNTRTRTPHNRPTLRQSTGNEGDDDPGEARQVHRVGPASALVLGAVEGKGNVYEEKVIDLTKVHNMEAMFCELEIHSKLSHDHIVKMVGWRHDAREQKLSLFLELVEEGSLMKQIVEKSRCFDEEWIWTTVQRIANALHYLHDQNIIHRDLWQLHGHRLRH